MLLLTSSHGQPTSKGICYIEIFYCYIRSVSEGRLPNLIYPRHLSIKLICLWVALKNTSIKKDIRNKRWISSLHYRYCLYHTHCSVIQNYTEVASPGLDLPPIPISNGPMARAVSSVSAKAAPPSVVLIGRKASDVISVPPIRSRPPNRARHVTSGSPSRTTNRAHV